MCEVTRRGFLATGAAVLATAGEAERVEGAPPAAKAAFEVEQVASGVHFAEGDIEGRGYSNNGWVEFDDYLLVIDANYPGGARDLGSRIRAVTDKPVRFAFDTHHHGDHAYGNQVWEESGATAVAHVGVVEEMRRYETGYYGGMSGRWEAEAKGREDVMQSRLKPPSVLFPKELYFDDGRHRVELLHLGVAHTHGDALAWLPNERILFTGDVCVNGPFNYVGDGVVEAWIRTLDEVRKLGARVVCPGHGARATPGVLEDQQLYFKTLWDEVGTRLSKLSPEDARGRIEELRAEIKTDPQIARYASGTFYDPFAEQVAKVYQEITGRPLVVSPEARVRGRELHARGHGQPRRLG
jgi:cyclase